MSPDALAAPLAIGGMDPNALAREFGTPLLVLDGDELDATLAGFTAAARALDVEISYAAKALLFVELARIVERHGLGIDVCSLGELRTVERASFPPARITAHGCGKTDEELRAALDGRAGRIVVDGLDEIRRLVALRASASGALDVLLRVNVGLGAHTHAHVRTGGEESKFGLAPEDLAEALALLAPVPSLRVRGVHSHIGSQIFDTAEFRGNAERSLDALARVRERAADADALVLGGGFGVEADPSAAPMPIGPMLGAIVATARAGAAARGIPQPRIGFEPGRAVVARAGTSLYRVVAVKRSPERAFAIVDGGMADNPRPALYGAFHAPALAGRASRAPLVRTIVCGRSCESDRLVEASLPNDLGTGDLLALSTTGAYTFSMASNYNRFERPAVAIAARGRARLAVRRQRTEDVLRDDVD